MADRIRKIVILTLVAACCVSNAFAQQKPDSLIINIGKSKLIFLVNDPKDLDELEKYDLNAILKELKLKMTSDSSLVTTDNNEGLSQDTTIIVDNTTRKEEWDREWSEEEDRRISGDDTDEWETERDRWREFRENQNDDTEWRDNNNSTRQYSSPRSRRLRSKRTLNFDLGINNYLNNGSFPEESDAQYAVRNWGSWYFAINPVVQTQLKGRLYIEWGPGISWYNFKFQDDRTLVTEVDGITEFISDPDTE